MSAERESALTSYPMQGTKAFEQEPDRGDVQSREQLTPRVAQAG
jgi:hypothetical protein